MKYLINIALIGVLLAGCADTPSKQASIEDRAVAASAAKKPADAAAAVPLAAPISDVSVKASGAEAGKAATASGVETHGVALQNPEAKPLTPASASAAGDKSASGAAPNAAAGQSETADALKFVAQPVLDPKNPQSPLAQRRLLFDYDSAAIRDEYRTLLEMHAQYLKNQQAAKLILQGHADERGSREYNLALGQRRSESVYKALNLLGVPDAQMEAVSLGEEKPVSEGHDESAWSQNRRTELLYQGE